MESLHIRELGILRDSEFDTTKPLILLAGPNRTGKTLVSYLMYGLSGFFNLRIDDYFKKSLNEKVIDKIKSDNIHAPILTEAFSQSELFLEALLRFAEPNTSILFNIEPKSIEINYTFSIKDYFTPSDKKIELDSQNPKPEFFPNQKTIEGQRRVATYFGELAQLFTYMIKSSNAFFLPCERLFATIIAEDLVRANYVQVRNNVVYIASTLPDNEAPSRYTKPIMDYITFIDDLAYITRLNSKDTFIPIADFLNRQLMGGQVQWKADQRRLIFNEYRTNKEIPFHLSASGIKSLTGLELYLRHQCVGDGTDILFFDEPELNLHPKAQRVVARVIARMINAGIKVVVSTHSDYIISQLSNLVVLGSAYQKDPEKVIRWVEEHDLDYEREDFLLPDQVAPYHFDFVESGEYAQATLIPPTEEGFNFPSMDETIRHLSNEINLLYSTLLDDE